MQHYSSLVGRALFSALFIIASMEHFRGSPQMIAFTEARGVPLPRLAILAAGTLMLAGGLSVLVGFLTRIGAGMILLCLLPVTFLMHPLGDPEQTVHFLKNLALMGGALLLMAQGPGPISLDARRAGRE